MGIVLVSTTVSLDGFIAGPDHEMDWIFDHGYLPEEPVAAVEEVIRTTGAILAGRRSYDVGRAAARPETSSAFGGRWSGPEFVLTHRPPSSAPQGPFRFLAGDIRAATSTALAGAEGRNLLVLGANVVQQCLSQDLVDEILLLVVPVLLGDGIRLFAALDRRLGFETVHVEQVGQTAMLRFRRRRVP
jgi:dihydrofolate reductase